MHSCPASYIYDRGSLPAPETTSLGLLAWPIQGCACMAARADEHGRTDAEGAQAAAEEGAQQAGQEGWQGRGQGWG